jgi:uncharacterized protein (DUF2235 family)
VSSSPAAGLQASTPASAHGLGRLSLTAQPIVALAAGEMLTTQEEPMGRNIILLSDGTGNSAGKLQKTNVWRLYEALDLSTDSQLAEYDDGVGTSSLRPLALIGSAFGIGLARNVRRLYAFLSRNYRGADDKVYAFGFSRGAFTIRLLIGLVRNQGLVDFRLPEQEFQKDVLARWDAFRSDRFRLLKGKPLPQRGLEEIKKERLIPDFTFVGLWDTVDAYGLPIDAFQSAVELYIYPFSFCDRHLSSIVKCAYHALSLDDQRRTFHPLLWDESKAEDRARMQQVWFPGVHSNIGGGYAKDGLAYVSLEWILAKAQSLGLTFLNAHVAEIKKQADAHDHLYDSRAGLASYYRYAPRPVTTLCHDTMNGVAIDLPKVHESAFARICGERVAYAPIGVPLAYEMVLRDGTVVPGPWTIEKDEKGHAKTDAGGDPIVVRTIQMAAAKSRFSEDSDRAQRRAERMEAVWDIVWWRRIVYFLTLTSSLFLILLPMIVDVWSTKTALPHLTDEVGAVLRPILKVAAYLVPNWVGETWLDEFGKEPVLFLIGVLCLAITMLTGLWQEETIRSRAGEIWHDRWKQIPKWAENPKSTWIYKLRSNKKVIKLYRFFAWRVLPTVVLVACVPVIAWLYWTYQKHVIVYGLLLLFAIPMRTWIFRGLYKAKRRKQHVARTRQLESAAAVQLQ